MTEDRLDSLERQIEILKEEHQRRETLMNGIASNVTDILSSMNAISSSLAAHTTIEAAHHADRSKLITRTLFIVSGVLIMLTAIYSAVTGVSMSSSLIPMLESLLGL